MKVFLSWSGKRSKAVAEYLRNWIPKVIQAAKPWMSDEDISAGQRWSAEIVRELQSTKVGIICVTPENQHNPWLMFEAGALSKTVTDTFVCPYLFNISPAEMSGPLSQFQACTATEDGTNRVLQTVNKALGEMRLAEGEFEEIFSVWWPRLNQQLEQVGSAPNNVPPSRTSDEMLAEVLENTREQIRREDERLKYMLQRDERFKRMFEQFDDFTRSITNSMQMTGEVKAWLSAISEKGTHPSPQELSSGMQKELPEIALPSVQNLDIATLPTDFPSRLKSIPLELKRILAADKEATNRLLNREDGSDTGEESENKG